MFILKNEAGAELKLIGNPLFDLSHIEGLTKYAGSLASSTSASADGDTVTNAQALPRDIVMDLTIKDGVNVENALDVIKGVVKPKKKLTLIWNDKTIEGIASDMDAPRFSEKVVLQISLHCSNPWWKNVQNIITEIAESIPLAHFAMSFLIDDEGNVESKPLGEIDLNRTKSFNNDGDVAVGMDISIIAVGEVVNPSLRRNNGDFIGCNVTLQEGDEIKITTHKGNKTITLNGENAMSKIMRGSSFMQLDTGEQEFTLAADSGASFCYFTVSYSKMYV
ncbi:MAG: phage tail family protein [Clostridia bacterium]|nr:phage tail family protein [Clostridia bacterium]